LAEVVNRLGSSAACSVSCIFRVAQAVSVFSRYRPYYRQPERISPENARLNRINAELQKNIEIQERFKRLSPAFEKFDYQTRRVVKDIAERPKAASIAAALSMFKESDFADPAKRLAYRELRASQGGQQKVKPAGSDRRQFNPSGSDFASTIYGGFAQIGKKPRISGLPAFMNSWSVIPCIERIVRREVMFARHKAGKGYHSRKRRTWASGVPC